MSGGVYIAPKVDVTDSALIAYIQGIMQVGDIATVADTTTGLLYYIPKSGSPYQAASGVTSVAGEAGEVTAAELAAALDSFFLTPAEGNAAYDPIGAAATVQSNLNAHINDTDDAHDASAISYAGSANLSATNVEAALDELDTEKAPLASPAFTGNPTAPTPTTGDNNTSIATTAFVNAEIGQDAPNVTLANVGSSPNAQGASLTGQQLTLQPANGTFAGLLTASGFNNLARFFGSALFNVKDFGAVADDTLGAGGTDNTTAFQNAINAAAAAGGGIVFFPAGRYSIQSGLTVRSNSVFLMGVGCSYTADVGDYTATGGSWIVWRGAAGGTMLDVFPQSGASVNPIFGFRISGLSFDGRDLQPGPTDTGANPAGIGIRMRACAGAHLDNFFLNGPFTDAALDLGALPADTIGGVDTHGTIRCIFERFCIRQLDGAAPGIGLRFSGTATANVNFCKFDTFQIMYKGDSTRKPAIQLGNSDSNTFMMAACNRAGSGTTNWGIEILGSNVSAAEVSRANIFYHCSAGANGAFLSGTALGRNPANTADATLNFTFPATDNQFRPISTENGEPVPVFGTGATGGYGITGGSTGPRFWGEGSTLASRAAPTAAITTTETSMLSVVLPANFLRAGTVLEFAANGICSNTTTASTWTARAKFGATNVAQNAIGSGGVARTNAAIFITGQVIVTAAGTAGTAIGQMSILPSPAAAAAAPGAGITAQVAVNTTIVNTLDFTIVGATGTPSITIHSAVIRIANQ